MRKLFVFLLLLSNYSWTQTVTTPDLNKSLIAPSPEAASFGKFGIQPVTLYSGMTNVSIPITELKSNKLSVNVSLAYNYNGYRPSEEATWVGLGWSLQGAGAITRIVKGRVDESDAYSNHWTDYADILDLTNNTDFMDVAGSGDMDTEPDIYVFNFNGHSGKFVLVGDNTYLFPHQDLSISKTSQGFKIIAEDGTNYIFEEQETTSPPNKTPGVPFMPPYISCWHLSHIISQDNLDQIDFYYTQWTYRQANNSYSETYVSKSGITSGGAGCNTCDSWTVNSFTGASVSAKQLNKISSRIGYITFSTGSSTRNDLSAGGGSLNYISTYDSHGTLLKTATLNHGYFGNTSYSTTCQLKLTSIDIQGTYVNKTLGSSSAQENMNIPGFYSFQYYNEAGSYPKGTRAIDKWGYFNGKFSNGSLFESSLIGHDLTGTTSADKTVDSTFSMNGLLSKVIYPTGGYTNFDYELNRIQPNENVENLQPRQSSLTVTYNGISDPTIGWQTFEINKEQTINITFGRDISNYPYGVYNNTQILNIYADGGGGDVIGALLYTSLRLGKSISSQTDTFHLQPGIYHYKVSCESTSISSFATIDYKWKEPVAVAGDPGPGLRIKSIKSYDNINNSVPAIVKNYVYKPAKILSANGYGFYSVSHKNEWGTYTENIYSSDYGSPLSTVISDQYFYPEVTEINNDTAASGKTVYQYSSDGMSALGVFLVNQFTLKSHPGGYDTLQKKTNYYDPRSVINLWGFTSNVSQVVDPPSCNCNMLIPPLESPYPLDTIDRFTLYESHPYALSSEYNYLIGTDEVNFDQNGSNPLAIHTDYYYDNPNHTQPTRVITKNSKDELITTQSKYPYDYSFTSCSTPYLIDSTYKTARDSASRQYQRCTSDRYNAAIPYVTAGSNENNTALKSVLRTYQCEVNYKSLSATALSNLNNSTNGLTTCLLNSADAFMPSPNRAITLMQAWHMKNMPIEQIVSLNRAGVDYLFGATKTDFVYNNLYGVYPQTLYNTSVSSTSITKGSFLSSPDAYYKAKVNFVYDANGNIKEQSKTDDIKMSYLWDYSHTYPIAQITNSDVLKVAYTSFESDGTGGWSIPSTSRVTTALTGAQAYDLSNGSITKSDLNSTINYKLSYWTYTGAVVSIQGASSPVAKASKNGWTYYEASVSGVTYLQIGGSGIIDELRLYPNNSQMTSYTYDPLIGLTSSSSINNELKFYQYDGLGRLLNIRDADQSILKLYDYKYKVSYTSYFSSQASGTFTKNDCSPGQSGSSVTYTVPYGSYVSTISQADADQKAQNDVNQNGQAYANANGSCNGGVTIQSNNYMAVSGFTVVYTNTTTNQQYTFSIPSGGGAQTLGSIPSGTYNIYISKAGNATKYLLGCCTNNGVYAASATFYNISVSSSSCNSIIIDSGI
ncbi:MAG: DUF5977 domain-containing protein [Candidatus Dadabacteria bacterium]